MSVLNGEWAADIAQALVEHRIVYTLTIPRTTVEPPPPGWPTWQPWEGEEETVEHCCQGFIDAYDEALIAAGVVDAQDVRIIIVKSTLDITIELTDIVVARDKTFTVLAISEDPAGATVELRARA